MYNFKLSELMTTMLTVSVVCLYKLWLDEWKSESTGIRLAGVGENPGSVRHSIQKKKLDVKLNLNFFKNQNRKSLNIRAVELSFTQKHLTRLSFSKNSSQK